MRRNDLIAGLSVAGLMLPEAVAYAGIAGLPPEKAIFAAIAGCLAYAVMGRSRFAIISPTSSSAAILAATLAVMPGNLAAKAALATISTAMVGLLFLFAGMARVGGFAGFVSRPVLRGFAFGLAITIILKQLPNIVGVSVHAGDVFHLIAALVEAAPRWNGVSIAVGALALAALLALRRFAWLPGALIVLCAGVAASLAFGLDRYRVALVGPIDMVLARPSLPYIGKTELSYLVQLTVPLVLILFSESWGTIKALALRHGDAVDANRELSALGVSNIASAVVQGMPVGAGFSAGQASESAGATSRFATIVAAAGLAALILFARPLIASLPQAVLSAVVIAALTHALNPAPLVKLWRMGRDQYVAIGAALGVLLFGVLNGMLIAIALSLFALIKRLASPHVMQLGRLGTSHDFVDLARHPDAQSPPGIVIWRPAQPLFFGNADAILSRITTQTRAAGCRAAVISLEESIDVDSSALEALAECDTMLGKDGIILQLARVHDHVRDLLAATHQTGLLARSSYSVDDAVIAVTQSMTSKDAAA